MSNNVDHIQKTIKEKFLKETIPQTLSQRKEKALLILNSLADALVFQIEKQKSRIVEEIESHFQEYSKKVFSSFKNDQDVVQRILDWKIHCNEIVKRDCSEQIFPDLAAIF